MNKKILTVFTVIALCFAFVPALPAVASEANPEAGTPISTNKDKLLTVAVHGQIAPSQPSRSYAVTWEGKPKMLIGTGGINYNLKIGDPIFGWSSADRATMGVAVEGSGDDRARGAWIPHVSVGNEVRLLSGAARGEKGVVTAKFGGFALVHFEDAVLDKLAVGDLMLARAVGIGLKIDGFDEIFIHGLTPEVLEKLAVQTPDGRIEVPVVKEIPGNILGAGAGGSSLFGHWHIQTCFPPDIEKYGLRDLRFGDLVLLKDAQTDYGKGYFKGASTIGIVASGPSDMSGLGIAVTPILSSRTDKLTGRIDPSANIGKYLGIKMKTSSPSPAPAAGKGAIRTNKDTLITTAVQAVVQPPGGRGYSVTYDGTPKIGIGTASINYTVSFGDPAYGWASADHVEPDVTVQGRDAARASDCAIAILAGIGNPAKVISGDAAGAKGLYIGRHAGAHDLVWFPADVKDNLALNDKIQVRARGVGLKIEDFEDVRVNKISPELLENMGIRIEDGRLVVPVAMEIPGHIMGSGLGASFIETLDYDIQTTCPETVERYGLKKIKLGDLVAIRDHYNAFGSGRYEGAMTIGVCIHGWSDYAGHGPGITTILSALPGRIEPRIDPHANAAYYLGIKEKPAE